MRRKKESEKEISSGIIVFRKTPEGPRFLILYHGHNYWNFPKGKIEKEEKSFHAAIRETEEETGLKKEDLKFVPNFRTKERFTFKRSGKDVYKTVIFFLAETKKRNIVLSKEHEGYGWFTYREALRLFPSEKHKDTRRVLKQVSLYLRNVEKNKKKTAS